MRSRGAVGLVVALLLAPAAAAGPAPALYFLKEGETPVIGDGILNETAPDGLDPSTRLVLPGSVDLPSAVFATPDAVVGPDRLLGPLLIGLWTGPSTVVDGNLSATIYLVEGTTRTPLGNASIYLQLNESAAPDPVQLVPPDPLDPEQAVAYIAAKAMAGLIRPPVLLQLGFVDRAIPEGSRLAVGFYLEPAEGSSAPAPVGGPASLQFDAALNPSFVYAPWYATDPEPTTSTSTTTAPAGSTTSGAPTLGGSSGGEEESPAGPLLVTALLLVGLAFVRRRL